MKNFKKKTLPPNTNHVFRAFSIKIDPNPDYPKNRRQALTGIYRRQWYKAEKSEYDSYIVNKTWILVGKLDLNESVHILLGKWVYKVKRNLQNIIIRWKARWVVRGFE